MTWYYHLEDLEYFLIGAFLLFYLFYFLRMWVIKRKIKTPIRRIFIKFVIRASYFSLLIISMLGPSFGDFKRELKLVSKDIFLIVDISTSMNAVDVLPSRLIKAKYELKNLVNNFPADRIGIIIFSSDAFIQCPLTQDKDAIETFINGLNTNLIDPSGTNLRAALDLCLDKFQIEESDSEKAQVAIVVSDGEDFSEIDQTLLDEFLNRKIRIYTLGIGTNKGSTIPLYGDFVKKDSSNHTVVSKLQKETLKSLSLETKGRYFEINPEKNQTNHLIKAVSHVEGKVREVKKMDVISNKYFYFLIIGLFLMIVDVLMTVTIIKI